jgi:hypothetical protein
LPALSVKLSRGVIQPTGNDPNLSEQRARHRHGARWPVGSRRWRTSSAEPREDLFSDLVGVAPELRHRQLVLDAPWLGRAVPPPGVSEYPPTIADLLDGLGGTHAEAGALVGLSRSQTSNIVAGRFGVSRSIAQRCTGHCSLCLKATQPTPTKALSIIHHVDNSGTAIVAMLMLKIPCDHPAMSSAAITLERSPMMSE